MSTDRSGGLDLTLILVTMRDGRFVDPRAVVRSSCFLAAADACDEDEEKHQAHARGDGSTIALPFGDPCGMRRD